MIANWIKGLVSWNKKSELVHKVEPKDNKFYVFTYDEKGNKQDTGHHFNTEQEAQDFIQKDKKLIEKKVESTPVKERKPVKLMAPEQKEEAIRRIVKDMQYEKIEGVIVDGTTANMLVTILNALNPESKSKFLNLPIVKMVDIGWKLVSKKESKKKAAEEIKVEVPVKKEAKPTPKPNDVPPDGFVYAWEESTNSWILVEKKLAFKKKSSDLDQKAHTYKFKTEQEAIDFTQKNKDMVMMDKPTPRGNWIVLYDPNGLLSDKPYVKKQSVKKIAVDFSEENVIKELATALDIDTEDIKVMRNDDDIIEVNADGEDYAVTKDENDAYEYAVRYVREMLDSDPGSFNQDWLQGYLIITETDRRIIAGEEADNIVDNKYDEDFDVEKKSVDDMENEDIMEEMNITIAEGTDPDEAGEILQNAKDYLEEKFEKEYEKELENAKEKMREEEYDNIYDQLADPVRYFVEDQGMYSIEDLMKASFISIDIEDAAVGAVDADGWAHYVSNYDGNYDTTKSGFVFWRV